jgi:multidrug resistance efflux pump
MTFRVPRSRLPAPLDGWVGKTVPLRIGDQSTPCTVLAVKVSYDDWWVEMTVEVADTEILPPGLKSKPNLSMGWKP